MFKITIPYEPTPKARARTFLHDGKYMSFTPTKTVNAEQFIRACIIEQGIKPIDRGKSVGLVLDFYLKRPRSLPKKITEPVKRPDIDNLIKTCLDALNKFAFEDDSQIIMLTANKHYGNPPHIDITISEV